MSSEQPSVSAQTVEQTKQQIRNLVGEIAGLSKSDVGAPEYYAAFMQRVVSALAAIGGAIWLLGEGKRPELTYQINLSEVLLTPGTEAVGRHLRLLNYIAQTGKEQLVPPMSGAEGEGSGGNPTPCLLVLAPLISDGVVEGVVEILQRPDSQPATQRGYLRFLSQMCELAGEWLKSRKLRHYSDRHSLWAQADQFARMVHEQLDVRETAYVIVNEGRRLVGCDRVSVAIKRGRTCKVEAVSGQDTIESRSNVVTALGRLATRVVATGESLWYEGASDDLPPQVEEAVDAYVDESYAKTVIVLPLRKPSDPQALARGRQNAELVGEIQVDREIVGALIAEQIETDLPRDLLESRLDLVYEHSTRALSNALAHQNVFLMPFWQAIGRSTVVVKGRNLPKTLTIGGIVLAIFLSLFLFRVDFDLKGEGALQPVKRRDVFVPENGTVKEVFVESDQIVTKGTPLVRLENLDLEKEREEIVGRLAEVGERLYALNQGMRTPADQRGQTTQVYAEFLQLQESQKNLRRQLALVEQKRKNLVVRSPIDGQVLLAWDAKQSLLHRPVLTGQRVMTVADPDGEWELELAMPERRMGHVRRADNKLPAGERLPVSYVSAAKPESPKHGKVKKIYGVTQVKGEEGPTVKITVEIDKDDLESPSPGTTVTAKVKCGRCSLGYSWFHEAIEWVQKHILF